MSLEIKVGPPQLSVHHGYCFMVSRPDGQIIGQGDKGLYFLDTRLISAWALYADGAPWMLLNGGILRFVRGARLFDQSRDQDRRRDDPRESAGLGPRPPHRRRHA